MDTIYSLASARGKAGVSVVRISGPDAFSAGRSLAGSLPPPRRAALRDLRDDAGALLDRALVLCFEPGHSFTGEATVELHLHGSTATLNAVLRALAGIAGLRPALAGEFTRRALENNRLDLAQVEGLADLIEAETEAQRRQAMRVLSGALGELTQDWRQRLIRAASLLEATIDFAEEDVPVDVTPEVCANLDAVLASLRHEARGARIAERIRDGFEVAIVGPPNVGKSTLLNALAGRDAAITSDIAGTTRDVIEVRMDLEGLAVTFLDTAGLRDSDDSVEMIGVSRAIERARAADLRVFLGRDQSIYGELKPKEHDIQLTPKGDLTPDAPNPISGKTGLGVSELIRKITDTLQERSANAGTATRERHRIAILTAISALESAQAEVQAGSERAEFAAEDIRHAIRALDSLVGLIDVEHLLDEIFSSFCIGK